MTLLSLDRAAAARTRLVETLVLQSSRAAAGALILGEYFGSSRLETVHID